MDEGSIKTTIPKCSLYWRFCLGWCTKFVGSESGQKHSCRIWSTTQLNNPPPTATHELSVYTVPLRWEGGRGGGGQREDRGATVHKRGLKYQHD